MTDEDTSLALNGVSQELVDVVNTVLSATSSLGSLRYSEPTARELRKLVICRQHSRPIWWLANLIFLVEHSGELSFADFIWDESINKKSVLLEQVANLGEGLAAAEESGILLKFQKTSFKLNYSQLSLLQALSEILIYTNEKFFDSINAHISVWESSEVDELAIKIRIAFDRYLGENLQPRQQYEKCSKMLSWAHTQNYDLGDDNADIDQYVLEFWEYGIHENLNDFRLFNNCASSFLGLVGIVRLGQSRAYFSDQYSSQESFYGEWNDEGLASFVDYIDEQESDLAKLYSAPLNEVKFFSSKDMQLLEDVMSFQVAEKFFAKTFLRSVCFGSRQLSISQFLRKGDVASVASLKTCSDVQSYDAICENLVILADKTKQTNEALLHILHQLKSEYFLGFFVENVEPSIRAKLKSAMRLGEKEEVFPESEYFENLESILENIPEINAKRLDLRRSFKAVNRVGFKDIPNADKADVYESGAFIINKLLQFIEEKSAILEREISFSVLLEQDRVKFSTVFRKIYCGDYCG